MSSPEPPSARSPRPRIRKAHSYEHEYSGSHARGADASPTAASTGGSHWYGDDGVLYYRGEDGAEFYCASDGAYYPRALLVDALAASSARSAGGSAEHDRSTYYEYIARHSAELPAQSGSAPGAAPGAAPASAQHGSGPAHEASTGAATADPSARAGTTPPRPSTPPPSPPNAGDPHAAPDAARGENGGRRRTGRVLVGTVAALAVLALGIGLGVAFLGPDRGMRPTDIESPGASSAPDSPAPGDTAGDDGAAAETAGEQLGAHVTEGTRIAEERLADQWVVQLSAKKPGLEAEQRTWDEESILEEFEENRRRHPEAVLLWSGDWSSFRLADFWVTVLAEPYDSPDQALATCTDLGLDGDNCFAKKLSTSEGPDGTTALND